MFLGPSPTVKCTAYLILLHNVMYRYLPGYICAIVCLHILPSPCLLFSQRLRLVHLRNPVLLAATCVWIAHAATEHHQAKELSGATESFRTLQQSCSFVQILDIFFPLPGCHMIWSQARAKITNAPAVLRQVSLQASIDAHGNMQKDIPPRFLHLSSS